MYWTISSSILALVFGMHSAASAGNASNTLPESSPVPGIQTGKLTQTSIRKLPPAARKMAEEELKEQAFGSNRRFGEISDDAIIYMKDYRSQIKNIRDVEKNLTFRMADVSRGEFKHYTLEGAYPEGPTKSGPWSSMTRVFKRDDDVIVLRHEWNYVGDGGGVMIVEELMNTRVGNSPARLSIKKSPAGWISSELMWVTKKRLFTLTVLGDVPDDGKAKYKLKWLTRLAAGIEEPPGQ
jgi:hypothetical protein